MGIISDLFRSVWRNFEIDGVPSSGMRDPLKTDIWAVGDAIDKAIAYLSTAASGTSTTSLEIAVGTKVFTTQEGRSFRAGDWLLAASDADATNQMSGQVVSYAGATLTVEVTSVGGSGTHADWTIRVAGAPGASGSAGSPGTSRHVTARLATTGNINPATDLVAGASIDGVAAAASDRVLLTRQANSAENGLYTVPSSLGSLTKIGNANSVSSGAALTATVSADVAIGDLLIVAVAADNGGVSGGSSVGAVTDSGATNSYTSRATTNLTPGAAANDGTTLALFSCVATGALVSGVGTISVAFSPNTTSRAMMVYKVVPAPGQTAAYVGVGAGVTQTATVNHTEGDVAVAAGQTIVVFNAIETFSAATGDGAWSTLESEVAIAGTGPSSQRLTCQWKTVAGASTQNNVVTTSGNVDNATNHMIVSGLLPSRDTSFQTYDAHAGIAVSVTNGETNGGKVFQSTAAAGGTLGTTSIGFRHQTPTPAISRASQPYYLARGITDAPILFRDFADTRTCEAEDRYACTSAAVYVDQAGQMRVASANVPRAGDHDPTIFRPLGLTIEGARTKCTAAPPEDFSDAGWIKSEVTVSTNVAGRLSPMETQTVDKIVPSTANAAHTIYEDVTVVSASHNFYSRWFAASGYTKIRITAADTTGTDGFRADFDLTTGEISNVTTIGAGAPGVQLAKYWTRSRMWRLGIGGVIGTVTTVRLTVNVLDASGNVTFAADGTSGVLMWGDQPEPGRTWTSYLSASGSAVARARGVHAVALPTLGSEITIHLKARVRIAYGGSQSLMEFLTLHDGTNNNRIALRMPATAGPAVTLVSAATTLLNNTQQVSGLYTLSGEVDLELAMAVAADGTFRYIMGSDPLGREVVVPNLVVPSGLTTLQIGAGVATTTDGYLTLEKLAIFPRALSLAEMQKLVLDRPAFVEEQLVDPYQVMPRRPYDFTEGFGYTRAVLAKLEQIVAGQYYTAPAALRHDILFIGDSQTQLAEGYLEPLAERFHALFGDGGEGYIQFAKGSTYGINGAARRSRIAVTRTNDGSWTGADDQQTPCRSYVETTTVGSKYTVDFGRDVDRVKFFFREGTSGELRWRVDAGSWTTQSTAGAGAAGNAEFVASGQVWEFEVTAGTCRWGGVAGYKDTGSGVRIHQLGNSGQGISDLYQKTEWVTQMQALTEHCSYDAPTLLILMVSSDQADLFPVTYNFMCDAVLTALRAAIPLADIGMGVHPENSSASFAGIHPMHEFALAVWAACRDASLPTPFINFQPFYGQPTITDALRYQAKFDFEDYAHFKGDSPGGYLMARLFEHWLLRA